MVKSILLVGVGGQGTILVTKILAEGLASIGHDIKMSEIHGMSQRGGTVTTQLKYGEKVFAPNIGKNEADVIVSFEKAEALRALPYLKKGGIIISDDREIFPMPVLTGEAEYPGDALELLSGVVDRLIVVKASEKASELGNIRVQNICLLGALVKTLNIEGVNWEKLISENVPAKVEEVNLAAFRAGVGMTA